MVSLPAWSMGTSQRGFNLKTEASEVPGPGSYAHESFRKTNPPIWKMGTSRRSSLGRSQNVPGPGNYGSPEKIGKRAPTYQIGIKLENQQTDRTKTPGPGTYDYKLVRSGDLQAPSYSMRTKSVPPDSDDRSKSPGPGAYDHTSRILNDRMPTYKIGNSQRQPLSTSVDTPGPGTYQITEADPTAQKIVFSWKFGTSDRIETKPDSERVPGPGTYKHSSSIDEGKGKGPTMLSRRPDTTQGTIAIVPGPGAYVPSIAGVKHRYPTFRIGTASREYNTKSKFDTPGPGTYPLKLRRSTSVRIGTSTRPDISNSTPNPGPGTYNYTLSTNSGPTHVMVPKRSDISQDHKDKNTPGPGAYVANYTLVKQNALLMRIGTSKRDGEKPRSITPGPDTYDVRGKFYGPKWGFGSEKRERLNKTSKEPGPGAYELPSMISNLPKYAMTGAMKTNRF